MKRGRRAGTFRRLISALLCVLAVGVLVGLHASVSVAAKGSAPSAKPPSLPEPLTREAIRELVARLSDQEVRQLLLAQLDKAAAPAPAQAEGGMSAASMARDTDRLRARVGDVLRAAPSVPGELVAAIRQFSEGGPYGRLQFPLACVFFAALLAAGGIVETRVARLLATVRRGLEDGSVSTFGGQVGRVLLRLTLDLPSGRRRRRRHRD